MASFVLDTSIAIKWFLEDESDRAYSLAILKAITDDYRPAVPWLWYYEIANVIMIQVRRKRIAIEDALVYLNIIDEMPSTSTPLTVSPFSNSCNSLVPMS
jgi:predicted nucleic acid-binding protein